MNLIIIATSELVENSVVSQMETTISDAVNDTVNDAVKTISKTKKKK